LNLKEKRESFVVKRWMEDAVVADSK